MGRHGKKNEKTGSYNPDGTPMGIKPKVEPTQAELQAKADSFDRQYAASKLRSAVKKGKFE